MVGHFIKSDILQVLELGGRAIYIPFHINWAHEKYEETIFHPNFIQLDCLKAVTSLIMACRVFYIFCLQKTIAYRL